MLASGVFTMSPASARPWTNIEGVTIEAEFVSLTNDLVILALPNGSRASYPLEKLIQSDQNFARAQIQKQAASQLAKESAPKPAPGRAIPETREVTTPELAKIPPPTDNSSKQIRRYIQALFAYDPYTRDPTRGDRTGMNEREAMLLALGESNVDLLIEEAFSEKGNASRSDTRVACAVIAKLAGEQHKPLILKSYQADYRMASTILACGWVSETEATTLQHLRKMERWNGYGGTEIDFVTICVLSKSDAVLTELIRYIVRTENSLFSGILNNVSSRRDVSKETINTLHRMYWDKIRKTADERDLQTANAMLALGDLDALKLVGRLLVLSPENREFYLKRSASLIVAYTDAPPGTQAELGNWVRENASNLVWDAERERFVSSKK